jgi:hypothetical protein
VGLILDSSVAIAAERRGETVQVFLHRVIETAGDQEAALSVGGVVELTDGIHVLLRPNGGRGARPSSRNSLPQWPFIR